MFFAFTTHHHFPAKSESSQLSSLPVYLFQECEHRISAKRTHPSEEVIEAILHPHNRKVLIDFDDPIVVKSITIVDNETIYVNSTYTALEVADYKTLSNLLVRPFTYFDYQNFVYEWPAERENELHRAFDDAGFSDFARDVLGIALPNTVQEQSCNIQDVCNWDTKECRYYVENVYITKSRAFDSNPE